MTDSRRRPRVPFEVEVTLRFPQRIVQARTADVTMEGLFVRCDDPPPVGDQCEVEILLSSGHDALPIRGRAHVVRHAGGEAAGMGLTFLNMAEDSQEHLWRVIRYNSPAAPEDPEGSP